MGELATNETDAKATYKKRHERNDNNKTTKFVKQMRTNEQANTRHGGNDKQTKQTRKQHTRNK